MLTWNSDPLIGGFGTWLRGYCPLPLPALEALAKANGQNPLDPNNYYDPESGYDGWELFGTFNGAPFSLYTRYGVLKVGGNDVLDVDALNAELERLCA
jgi:hypothetical protein